MKKINTLVVLFSLGLAVTGCSASADDQSKTEKSTAEQAESTTNPEKAGEHIDYDKQEEWEFTAGDMQSPIDIPVSETEAMTEDTGTLVLDYDSDVSSVENNGHSIQVANGGKAQINGRNFTLTQFHFHAQSEHTIDGEHYPMEAHFVHTAQDGRIAVVGVFFEEGEENQGFQEVLEDVHSDSNDPITDLDDLLPSNKSYYHYLGSLTTPPLNENVEWYVLEQPVAVSSDQIESFKELYSHNNRAVQPLNDRVILKYSE